MKGDELEIEMCDSCGFYTTDLKEYPRGNFLCLNRETGESEKANYCKLCAGTLTGTKWDFGQPEHAVMSVVCYVGNTILKALADKK